MDPSPNQPPPSSEQQPNFPSKNQPDGPTVAPLQTARRGLLKAMWETSFAPRFSSRPIDMDDYFSRESFADSSLNLGVSSFALETTTGSCTDEEKKPSIGHDDGLQPSLVASKNLTLFEQSFLEKLLQSDDLDSIRKASERLADKELFPPAATLATPEHNNAFNGMDHSSRSLKRRESDVQQELFRLHENVAVKPSTVLQRMTHIQNEHAASRARRLTASTPLIPPLMQSNSILTQANEETAPNLSQHPPHPSHRNHLRPSHRAVNADDDDDDEEEISHASWDMASDFGLDRRNNDGKTKITSAAAAAQQQQGDSSGGSSRRVRTSWNPFGDVNSWIDGNQGFEVDGDGIANFHSPTSNPFKILGTSADDVSAHPHVLTPPLMESLQQFMPESLQEYHFWLKYSLVRDAPAHSHCPLLDMLRHCRASSYTVLAMETTEGNVFGAFCSQPWKLQDEFWGTKDSFVWRMRRSRNEPCESIVEQVLMESKIDVFPFTGRNSQVQQCSKDQGLVLGEGEEMELSKTLHDGEHYGNAIRLNAAMTEAWTSTCETFGNPCLVHTDRRGERVTIANVELWALTPHRSIESAITAEMKDLFLAETRGGSPPTEKNLDLFEIIVGGPV